MRRLLFLLLAPALGAQPFTPELWTSIQPVYGKTLEHPFLSGLTDGSLPRQRFQFYLQQDSTYLKAFSQALYKLAAKAPDQQWGITLARHASEAIQSEQALHESILTKFGSRGASNTAMAPTNYAYTNHLLLAVETGTFAEGLAAMLPCYWIYKEVGKELVKKGSRDKDYQKWIDNYAGEDYAKSVREVLAMMDAEATKLTAAQKMRCRELFVLSARYEYAFWDMAWREERWLP